MYGHNFEFELKGTAKSDVSVMDETLKIAVKRKGEVAAQTLVYRSSWKAAVRTHNLCMAARDTSIVSTPLCYAEEALVGGRVEDGEFSVECALIIPSLLQISVSRADNIRFIFMNINNYVYRAFVNDSQAKLVFNHKTYSYIQFIMILYGSKLRGC